MKKRLLKIHLLSCENSLTKIVSCSLKSERKKCWKGCKTICFNNLIRNAVPKTMDDKGMVTFQTKDFENSFKFSLKIFTPCRLKPFSRDKRFEFHSETQIYMHMTKGEEWETKEEKIFRLCRGFLIIHFLPPHIIKVKSMKFIILPLQTLTLLFSPFSVDEITRLFSITSLFSSLFMDTKKSRDFFLVKSRKSVLCRWECCNVLLLTWLLNALMLIAFLKTIFNAMETFIAREKIKGNEISILPHP